MAEQKEYLRFTVPQRLEHWVLFVSFTGLVFTGIPQKFSGDGWAQAAIGLMGGIEPVRIIHHTCAIILALAAVYHIIAVAYKVLVLRVRWTMFPRVDDALDALDAIRYNLGLTKDQPKLGRYNFAEKAEYWALIWGTLIMGATGFIMWNPITFARFFPGDLIPAAKAAHGAEAILAALAILIWHFYHVHIKTFSRAMFGGKLTEHEMKEDHALELERIQQGQADPRPAPQVIRRRERAFIPIAAVAAVVMLLGLYFLTTYPAPSLTTLSRRPQPQVPIYVPITPTPTLSTGTTPAPTSGSVSAVKPLPADHAGRTTCLACHANGAGPALPADHTGRTDATCAACHKVGSAPATQPTTAPTSVPAAQPTSAPATSAPTVQATSAPATSAPSATAAPTTAPASTSAGPKPQPADHAGRTTCTACHANGVGPAEPADHAGRTDATCAACHKQP